MADSKVERFNPSHRGPDPATSMHLNLQGGWVKFEDYERVEGERDEAQKEGESLRGELATLLGPQMPREGVTRNEQWIAAVAAVLDRAEKAEAQVMKPRARALLDVAEAFETRPPTDAIRCPEVALYCREQAALLATPGDEERPEKCQRCKGRGYWIDVHIPCDRCNGTGKKQPAPGASEWPEEIYVGQETVGGRVSERFLLRPQEAAERQGDDFVQVRRYVPAPEGGSDA